MNMSIKHIRMIKASLLVLFIMLLPSRVSASEAFELHLLNVGQGQSVLIKADGHYMLIDGGGRETSSFVVSYLKQQGIEKMDCVVASHYDEDHLGGVIGSLSVFSNDLLLVPTYTGEGDIYQSFATAAVSNGCVIMHVESGWTFPLGNANVEIVGPVQNNYSNENDRSLVLRITYGDTNYLICGDAEQQSETDMANSGEDLRADVLVVGHHGSRTSSMDAFLNIVSPDYALISCGQDNAYGHPAMETMQRLQNHGVSMFRTDKQGTVIVYSDGKDIWFNVDPSGDWTTGNENSDSDSYADEYIRQIPLPDEIDTNQAEKTSYQYVCNTNTKKFHYPDCNSVDQMKEENRLYTDLSRDELINEGYKPCGNCKP